MKNAFPGDELQCMNTDSNLSSFWSYSFAKISDTTRVCRKNRLSQTLVAPTEYVNFFHFRLVNNSCLQNKEEQTVSGIMNLYGVGQTYFFRSSHDAKQDRLLSKTDFSAHLIPFRDNLCWCQTNFNEAVVDLGDVAVIIVLRRSIFSGCTGD